jgi:hypothetical protein
MGILSILVGLLLWGIALTRKYQANWEDWDGKLHLQTGLICSAPIAVGIIIITVAIKVRRRISN